MPIIVIFGCVREFLWDWYTACYLRIRIRIRTSAGSLPKRCGFITSSASVISPSVMTVWEMLTNLLKSPIRQWWWKWKVVQNPYPRPDHRQKSKLKRHIENVKLKSQKLKLILYVVFYLYLVFLQLPAWRMKPDKGGHISSQLSLRPILLFPTTASRISYLLNVLG